MQIATISSKYQILVPKKIREQLHIKPGQQFIFIVKGGSLELIPKKEMKELRGILAGANTAQIRDRKDRT
jgi:AbrB family looped-hinge helix DNA binding protein